MVAMEVILDKEKSFNITVEEFALLLKVYDNFRLGSSRCEFIDRLEMVLDDSEEGAGNEFNPEDKATATLLIPKINTLTDEQANKIDTAIEKADELFSIFYFFNPLEKLGYIEPLINGLS